MHYTSQNARFSSCGRYRYNLERSWKGGKGRVLFIALNPSTADDQTDDPTTRRCVSFAHTWGYQKMEIVNLFAYRATYFNDLKNVAHPIGYYNDGWIAAGYDNADLVIACWGSHGNYLQRGDAIRNRFKTLHCINCNKTQQPSHPLYQKGDLKPLPMLEITKGQIWEEHEFR